jgi:hypothetical protein
MVITAEYSLTSDAIEEVDISSYKGGVLSIMTYDVGIYVVLNCVDSTEAGTKISSASSSLDMKNRIRIPSGTTLEIGDISDINLVHFKRMTSSTATVFIVLDSTSKIV